MYKKNEVPFMMNVMAKDDRPEVTVVLVLDKSGSMGPHEKAVYDSAAGVLKTLAKKNVDCPDLSYKVLLVTFNDGVKVINAGGIPLDPAQLLEVFDENDYRCSGGTSMAAVFDYVDGLFSRSESGLLGNVKVGDAYPMVMYVSDVVATDSRENYEESKNKLLSNRFYNTARKVCIYVGSENRKMTAAELVGGADNVIAIDTNIDDLLAPVMIGSSITGTDATHIGNANKSTADIAKETKERADEGSASAKNHQSADVEDEFKRMMEELTKHGV